jgi:hypothetical protein
LGKINGGKLSRESGFRNNFKVNFQSLEVPKVQNRSESLINKSHGSSELSLREFYFRSFKMRNIAKFRRDEARSARREFETSINRRHASPDPLLRIKEA